MPIFHFVGHFLVPMRKTVYKSKQNVKMQKDMIYCVCVCLCVCLPFFLWCLTLAFLFLLTRLTSSVTEIKLLSLQLISMLSPAMNMHITPSVLVSRQEDGCLSPGLSFQFFTDFNSGKEFKRMK